MTKKKGMPKQGSLGSKTLKDYDEWALSGAGGFMRAKPSNLKGFISMQFREGTKDILVIDDPDSTTGGTKKKKKKKATKRVEESDKESNASKLLAQLQRPHTNSVMLAATEVQCLGMSRHHLRDSRVKKKVAMKMK